MSHFLDRLTFFNQPKEAFSDGHGVTASGSRAGSTQATANFTGELLSWGGRGCRSRYRRTVEERDVPLPAQMFRAGIT